MSLDTCCATVNEMIDSFSFSCLPFDRQVLELKLIALRPVVPSHNVRLLSPVLAVPNLEVLSHNSVPLRCRLFQVTIIRSLELQVPPRQKFQSCEVWFINWSTCANRTSNNFLSCAGKSVSCGMSCGPSGQPQYLHPKQQVFPTRVPTRVSGVPHSNLMPRVVLHGARNKSLPCVQCNFAAPIARVRDARCTRAGHPVVPGSAGGMGAPQWCPGLAPAGSAKPIARASVADCIEALSVPPVGVVKSRHQVVWWACARRIAIIPNAALLPPHPHLPPLPDVIRTAVS